MKNLFLLFFFCPLLALGKNPFSPLGYKAQWDPDPSAGIQNGAGAWDNTQSNFTYNNGGANSAFAPGADVTFGGSGSTGNAGAVAVTGVKYINSILFDTVPGGNYALSGGTITCSNTGPNCNYTVNSDVTISSVINGVKGIIKAGNQTLTLSGANTYSGGTTVSVGTLKTTVNAGAGTGSITLGDANTGTSTVSWLFQGGGTPANNIVVSSLGSGNVTIGSYNAGTFTLPSGTLSLNRAITLIDATNDRTTFTGKISGNVGTISITGPRITFSNATNDFLGNLSVGSGSIYQNDSPSALPPTTGVTLNGNSTFRLNNGTTHAIDWLSSTDPLSVATIVTGGNATFSLGNNNGNGDFAGIISNGPNILSVAKNGTGTQGFKGANTYTGATTINAGVLSLNNTAFNTTGRTYTVSSGGTLRGAFTGNSNIAAGTTTINGAGKFEVASGNLNNPTGPGRSLVMSLGGGGLIEIATGATLTNGGWTAINWTSNLADLLVSGVLEMWDGSNVIVGKLTGLGSVRRDQAGVGGPNNQLVVGSNNVTGGIFSGSLLAGGGSIWGLTKIGTGTQTLTAPNSYKGATTISGGTLQLDLLANLGDGLYTANIANNGTLRYSSASDQSITGTISGSGSLIKDTENSSLTLVNAQSYTGPTTLSAGSLTLSNVGNGFISSTSIATGTNLFLSSTNSTVDTMVLGSGSAGTQFTGTGTITKIGTGWVMGDNNVFVNFSGLIDIQNGTLGSAFTRGQFGNAASPMIINIEPAGKFDLRAGGVNAARIDKLTGTGSVVNTWSAPAVTLSVGTSNGSSVFDGKIMGAGGSANNTDNAGVLSLVKVGTGTLTLSAANTYTGTTTINGGALQAGSSNSVFGNNSPVIFGNVAGAILDLNDKNISVGSLAGGGATGGEVTLGSGILTMGGHATPTDFSGVISGTGEVIKLGSGTQTLSGNNTFTGALTIHNGVSAAITGSLVLGAGGSLSTEIINIGIGASAVAGHSTLQNKSANQFNPLAVINFNGVPGKWAYWQLLGNNQEVAGIRDTGAAGVVENTESQGGYGGSTLTLSGSGTYAYNGHIRNTAGGSGTISIVKSGSGTQTFSGTLITYTGSTTINGGTLKAGSSNSVFGTNSALTIADVAGAILDLDGFSVPIGSLAGGGSVDLSGSANLTVGGNNTNTTFSGIILGDGRLKKVGTGSQGFAGENTYTGGTDLAGGAIRGSGSSPFGDTSTTIDVTGSGTIGSMVGGGELTFSHPIVISPAVTLSLDSAAATQTFSGVISGAGNLSTINTGTTILTATNTYTGGTTLSGGTLQISGAGSLGSGAYAGAIANAGSLIYSSSADQTLSGVISGTGKLIKDTSASTLTLTNKNPYSGGTTISNGTITLTNNFNNGNSSIGTGTITIKSGATLNCITGDNCLGSGNAANMPQIDIDGGTLTSSTPSPSGIWSKRINFLDGGTVNGVNGLYCHATIGSSIGVTASSNTATIATKITNTMNTGSGLVLTVNDGSADPDLLISGVISGAGILTKSGAGKLLLTGTNSYTGSTTISGGTLILGDGTTAGNIIPAANLITNSATLNYNTPSNITHSGVISGIGKLIKQGTGNLTLSGANTYTGSTDIQEGTLTLSASQSGTYTGDGTLVVSGNINSTNVSGMTPQTSTAVFSGAAGVINSDNQTWNTFQGVLNLTGSNWNFGSNAPIQAWGLTGNGTMGSRWGSGSTRITLMGTSGTYSFSGRLDTCSAPECGPLQLIKSGGSTQIFTSNFNLSSPTQINGGTLSIQGNMNATDYTIATGAAISGGNATTGITRNLTFSNPGSIYAVNAISATQASRLTCATLAGAFTVNIEGAMNVGTYPILTSTAGTPAVSLGTNTTGWAVVFNWVGQTLNMTLN